MRLHVSAREEAWHGGLAHISQLRLEGAYAGAQPGALQLQLAFPRTPAASQTA